MTLHVTLPMPPSTNHVYRVMRGYVVMTATGKQYKRDAGLLVANAAQLAGWTTAAADRYNVTVVLHWPNRAKHDLDNAMKVLLDSAAAALGFDDGQIDVLTIRRGDVDKANPRAELTIAAVGAL